MKDSDDARSRLYSLCEGEIDGGALRELGLILRGHSYLLNMLDDDATPLEVCVDGFGWDESEARLEAVKMIVDAGAGLDEWDDMNPLCDWHPTDDDLTYTPLIRPEKIPVIGENAYSGVYAPRIAGYIVRNYAATHPHTRELCAGILCARSMNSEELALLKALFPNGKGIDDYDDEGMTPLMSCIRSAGINRNDRNLDAVKFLIESGADVNKRKNHDNRFTPLIYAAMSRCSYAGEIIECLVEHGADINATFDAKGTRAVDILRQNITREKERVISLLQ
ncbi:MAG: ankyrin repeat domain-containing protein [Synergistaceae bacterium]|nr:ankyrin repeat domain-containing protein [Synergistaceae bacterium]